MQHLNEGKPVADREAGLCSGGDGGVGGGAWGLEGASGARFFWGRRKRGDRKDGS